MAVLIPMKYKMAAGAVTAKWQKTVNLTNYICTRFFHKTLPLCEITAGKYKRTKDQSKPLTYEQAQRPAFIAHRKSWNSWNTSNLEGGKMIADTLVSDLFIRKFIIGTFPSMVCSEIIIKRQHNVIRISFLLQRRLIQHKLAFLYAYTEEMLGYWLQCIVKLEPQLFGSHHKKMGNQPIFIRSPGTQRIQKIMQALDPLLSS